MQSIEETPNQESPELFGMHPNVDLTFRKLQVQGAVQVIMDTQPQGPTAEGSSSIEETVDRLCEELLTKARSCNSINELRDPRTSQWSYPRQIVAWYCLRMSSTASGTLSTYARKSKTCIGS